MCSLHLREVVLLSAFLSEVPLGMYYTCPHTLMVHLTQLGRAREVNTLITHPQLMGNSVLTALKASDET